MTILEILGIAAFIACTGGFSISIGSKKSSVIEEEDPSPFKLARSDYYNSRSDDEDDAKEALESLTPKLLAARRTTSLCTQSLTAAWHIERAQDWNSIASRAFAAELYGVVIDHCIGAGFHTRMAEEVVAEYNYARSIARVIKNGSTQTVVIADIEGAENSYEPGFCDSDDDEAQTGMRVYRKLSLLIARTQGIIDGNCESFDLTPASRWLGAAIEAMKGLETIKKWQDVPEQAERALFLIRTANAVIAHCLEARYRTVSIPSAEWDMSDEPQEDVGESETWLTSVSTAMADAQIARVNTASEPTTSTSHMTMAENRFNLAVQKYCESEYDESVEESMCANFHANVAREACEHYYEEYVSVGDFLAPTCTEDDDETSDGFCDSEDSDQCTTWTDWRQLTLKVARLQAFLDRRCADFTDRRAHMRAATVMVERVDNIDSWDEGPDLCSTGCDFVEVVLGEAQDFLGTED